MPLIWKIVELSRMFYKVFKKRKNFVDNLIFQSLISMKIEQIRISNNKEASYNSVYFSDEISCIRANFDTTCRNNILILKNNRIRVDVRIFLTKQSTVNNTRFL